MMSAESSIKNARSKLETVAWFLARPAMYRELARRIVARQVRTERTLAAAAAAKEDGQRWCRAHAVPVETAMSELGLPVGVESFRDRRPDLWEAASTAFEACAGTMGGAAHIDVLHHLVLHTRPARVVETGVAAGWSSLAILAAMDESKLGHLTSIDMPYPKRKNEDLVGCVVPSTLRRRWTLLRAPDRDALPKALRDGPVGLAHYDSDKSYEGRMFAYPLVWKALAPGGILISDDIEDNGAFREFAERVGKVARVIEKSPGNFAGLLVR